MDFEVEGYEEAIKHTEKTIKDINQLVPNLGDELVSIAESILRRAKEICNDPDCRLIRRNRIEFVNNNFTMDISYENNHSRDCMIQAIRETLPAMHQWQRQIFDTAITRLENEKTNHV